MTRKFGFASAPLPLVRAVAEAQALLADFAGRARLQKGDSDPLPSLLAQCAQLVHDTHADAEPYRRLLYSDPDMLGPLAQALHRAPNVVLLASASAAETPGSMAVDRVSGLNLIHRLDQTSASVDPALVADASAAMLTTLQHGLIRGGQHLVQLQSVAMPRDDAGSGFAAAQPGPQPARRILVLRHPAINFERDAGIDLNAYCTGWLDYLDRNPDLTILRYETLTAAPARFAADLGFGLDLAFPDHAPISGSPSPTKTPFPTQSRLDPDDQSLPSYVELCTRLGYVTSPDPAAPPALVTDIAKPYHRTILVVGHPRTGTAFAAALLTALGLDIGHERDGKDGISSWMFAVEDAQNPYAVDPVAASRCQLRWDHLLHPVRNIVSAVPSIMREDAHAPLSLAFRSHHILRETGTDLDLQVDAFAKAVLSMLEWSRIIERLKPALVFRIEDQQDRLVAYLRNNALIAHSKMPPSGTVKTNEDKAYQGFYYPKPTIGAADWAKLDAATWSGVVAYCQRYGYDVPSRDEA